MSCDRRVAFVVGIVAVSLLGLRPVGGQGDADGSLMPDQNETVTVADQNEAGAGIGSVLAGRITAGSFFTCFVLDGGDLRCWGRNVSGQLGYGNTETIGDDETPASVGPVDLGPGRTAVAISAGGEHSCVVLDNGTVRCWGLGYGGRLGYGSLPAFGDNDPGIGNNETPGSVGPVDLGPGRTAIGIAAGGAHSCALLDNGTVPCWGEGTFGQLGLGYPATIGDNETPGSVGPVDLGPGRTAKAVTAGSLHTCALLDNGTVRCWGANTWGKLGYPNTIYVGDDETPGSVGPVDLGPGRTAKAITAGADHTCALLDNGAVRCWGYGNRGRLGYGNTQSIGDNETPGSVGPVDLGPGRTAVAISASLSHTCALLDNGTVRCWGSNDGGWLGYGNTETIGDDETPGSVGPVDLGVGRTAVAVTTGAGHTCAMLDDATLRCWGRGGSGALGYGNTYDIGDNESPGSAGPVRVGDRATSVSVIYVANRIASGPADYAFLFGTPYSQIIAGDWDGNGTDGFGSREGNVYTLADEFGGWFNTIGYGKASDTTLVGDWDANGTDTLAARRGNIYYLKNTIAPGNADIVLGYGKAGDEVFVGDWNGNGQDTFAVRRRNTFYVRNSTTTGVADIVFGYGKAGDEVLVGDWNQDTIDTFAVRRGNMIYIRDDFQPGPAQRVIGYGKAVDELLVGDWNADGVDTFAVRRLEPAL